MIFRYRWTEQPALARRRSNNLREVVEVVPVVAGADPVVVDDSVVGLVVGVDGGVVQLADLGVLAGAPWRKARRRSDRKGWRTWLCCLIVPNSRYISYLP